MGAASAFAGAEAARGCQVQYSRFSQKLVWYGEGQPTARIRIDADSACASRLGRPLELKNVTVTMEQVSPNGQDVTRLFRVQSAKGLFSEQQKKFVLGPTYGPTELGCDPTWPLNGAFLLIDLKEAQVRAPGLLIDLAKSGPAQSVTSVCSHPGKAVPSTVRVPAQSNELPRSD